MSNFSKKDAAKIKTTFFMALLFVFVSNSTAFGQTTVRNGVDPLESIENNTNKQEATQDPLNMNFVLWFMGSKQSPNILIVPDGTATKKQFMTSGTAPNRLLIKTFLKKAVNFESAVV